MKNLYYLITVITFLTVVSCSQPAKQEAPTGSVVSTSDKNESRIILPQSESDTLKGSLKAKAMGTIGSTAITINYYSPAVRGRIIWGGLVPYESVWVSGAHRATSIEFNQDVKIADVKIPAGKYALFTIPGNKEWTIIINKNWEQHLADDYDQKLDIVRVKVKPEKEEMNQERLRYAIENESDLKGEIVLYWEKLEVSLPISGL